MVHFPLPVYWFQVPTTFHMLCAADTASCSSPDKVSILLWQREINSSKQAPTMGKTEATAVAVLVRAKGSITSTSPEDHTESTSRSLWVQAYVLLPASDVSISLMGPAPEWAPTLPWPCPESLHPCTHGLRSHTQIGTAIRYVAGVPVSSPASASWVDLGLVLLDFVMLRHLLIPQEKKKKKEQKTNKQANKNHPKSESSLLEYAYRFCYFPPLPPAPPPKKKEKKYHRFQHKRCLNNFTRNPVSSKTLDGLKLRSILNCCICNKKGSDYQIFRKPNLSMCRMNLFPPKQTYSKSPCAYQTDRER